MEQNRTKTNYFLYARKSSESEDRQIQSIDDQVNRLKILAGELNIDIKKIYTEAKSAKKPDNRPLFDEMIQRIERGEADGILCWQINRLSRNPVDSGKLSWLLQRGILKSIQTIDKQYLPEDNVIVFAVETGTANQFILDLSKNVKRGMQRRIENGWKGGLAPAGYVNELYNHTIVKDEERFDLIRKAWDLMLTGNYTVPQILDKMNNEWGFKTLKRKHLGGVLLVMSALYKIFTNIFYTGIFLHNGQTFQGKHEPMITLEEYDKVQIILGRKGKPRPKTHKFAYTGIIDCGECGAMITAEDKVKHQKNGNIHFYTYYHCTKKINPKCSQKSIRKEELEKQISDILETIEIPPEFREWALNVIKENNEKEFTNKEIIIQNHQKAYNTCVQKLNNLIDMRANAEINEEEFLNKKSEINQEKERLSRLLKDGDYYINDWVEKATELFTFAELARYRFENGTLEEKKMILASLGQNLSLKEGKLAVSLEKPFLILKKTALEVKQIHERLEPPENALDKRKLGEIYAQFPALHGM